MIFGYISLFLVFVALAYHGMNLDLAAPFILTMYVCVGAAGWVFGFGLRVAKVYFFN